MNIKKCALVLLMAICLVPSSTGWAQSRSATIRVSCTILPAIQLSSFSSVQPIAGAQSSSQPSATKNQLEMMTINNQIQVATNLGKQYSVSEQFLKTSQSNIKLYSVTAL